MNKLPRRLRVVFSDGTTSVVLPSITPEAEDKGVAEQSFDELRELAAMLMTGWIDPKTAKHRYFKSDSKQERAAYCAIAHLLRRLALASPHNERFLLLLADLYDPRSTHARRAKVCFRQEGGQGSKAKRIGAEIARMTRNRTSTAKAVEAVALKYGVTDRYIRRVWSKRKKAQGKVGGP
jgi:hypothetical protein